MTNNLVITGTTKGIGKKLAKKYLREGRTVAGIARSEKSIEHKDYKHFKADITEEEQVIKATREIKDNFEEVYGLINNAGIASMNHVILTENKSQEKTYKVNVGGLFLMTRELSKIMIKKGRGRIINMTSVAKPLQLEGEAIYSSSKAAVEQFTKVCARELSDYGITVNAVGPTPIKTDLIKGVPKGKIDDLISRQAIERYTKIADIKNVVDFYLREESEFVTGQVIYLGGVNE